MTESEGQDQETGTEPDQTPFSEPATEEVERGLNPFEKETRSDD